MADTVPCVCRAFRHWSENVPLELTADASTVSIAGGKRKHQSNRHREQSGFLAHGAVRKRLSKIVQPLTFARSEIDELTTERQQAAYPIGTKSDAQSPYSQISQVVILKRFAFNLRHIRQL